MVTTITKTINISASVESVWTYVSNLSKWAEWAIHNVYNVKPAEDNFWLMEGPRGISRVKMYSNRQLGLLDHDFIDPAEGHWNVPCRVVASNNGAHFMITFTKPGPVSDEAFLQGMQLIDEELLKLKQILESNFQFTYDQIKAAHSKVKTGADFPLYISALKMLGITSYTTCVEDGHTDYYGNAGQYVKGPAIYNRLPIAYIADKKKFEAALKIHQMGQTDFLTFCRECAEQGIEQWVVSVEDMTCTYYDKGGQIIRVEEIPRY